MSYLDPRPQHLGDVTPQPEPEPEPAKRGPGRRRAGNKKDNAGKGRAGRNLPAAIAVGVSLVLLVLASLLIWPPAFPGLIAVAAGAGVWEMTRALKVTGAEPPLIPLLGGALLMVGLAWHDGPDSLLIGLVVTVVAALL
jgi:phosphatidate cytidylyltransferase